MHRVEDYYMMAKLYAHGYRGYNIPEVLLRYRDDEASFVNRKWKNRLSEVYTYWHAYHQLRIPFWRYYRLLRPILVGLLPRPLYNYLHRRPWQ
jgi:glycosyltransferase EpsE